MDELNALSDKDRQYLWRALESALGIRHRGQFFLWAQGQLQAVLPHGVMVAVAIDPQREIEHRELMQGVPLEPHVVEALSQGAAGVVARMAACLRDQGATQASWDGVDVTAAGALRGVAPELQTLGLTPAMCQSSGPLPGRRESFFALFKLPQPAAPTQSLLLDVLLPQLHLALSRSAINRPGGQLDTEVDAADDSGELTDRQLEILHWVKLGKTNQEISQILGISALTVKNHMQKLFRKLDVHNRAQAVAKVMSLRDASGASPSRR